MEEARSFAEAARHVGPSKDEWETEHERWLREAVFRADGVGGLGRIARKTKRPQACLAWYEALADQGAWTAALKACDAAARMVRQSHWRVQLLDGAALAAQSLAAPICPSGWKPHGAPLLR
ncbi:MAG: hypothetical protein K2Y23_12965 [Cyanobacteria bacterium]|nr:hypothetical protein [Cyanobacteriota bacterium]